MSRDYKAIARVVKTHGRAGEVVVEAIHGLPLLVHEGMELVAVPPELEVARAVTVTRSSQLAHEQGALVALKDVSSINDAERYVGKTLLAQRTDLPGDVDVQERERLIGREVLMRVSGEYLGTIAEVLETPAHDVWVIKRPQKSDILLPVVDAFVPEIPLSGPLQVLPPHGLIEAEDEA